MSKIHILSEHLTNMIAAGEVVERPAGIVKECVENSIDAHAKTIEIEAFQGGIERLVITDALVTETAQGLVNMAE